MGEVSFICLWHLLTHRSSAERSFWVWVTNIWRRSSRINFQTGLHNSSPQKKRIILCDPLKTLLNHHSTKHLLVDKMIEYLEESCLTCSCFKLKSWMYGWWFQGLNSCSKRKLSVHSSSLQVLYKCWDVLVLLLCDLLSDVFQMSFPEPLIGDDGLQWRSARRLVEMLMAQPERWKHRFPNILFSVLFWQVNLRNLNMCLPVK